MSRDERVALLDNDSEDEGIDDFFLHGPKMSTSGLREQLDDVADIARDNVKKMAERGERLDNLEERSVRMDEASANFRAGAYVIKRKAWWQNAKYKAVGVSALVIVLFLIIIIIISRNEH